MAKLPTKDELMFQLMLLRNKGGQGTKLEEGYISCPDWGALLLHCHPGMKVADLVAFSKNWRDVNLGPLFQSKDRPHALNYEVSDWEDAHKGFYSSSGKKKPAARVKPNNLFFYHDPKRSDRARRYFLTKDGEARVQELLPVIMDAFTDFPRKGPCSPVHLPGTKSRVLHATNMMTHFYVGYGDHLSVDDYVVGKGNTWMENKKRNGAIIQLLSKNTEVTILDVIKGDVLHIQAPSGEKGFVGFNAVHHELVKDYGDNSDEEGVE